MELWIIRNANKWFLWCGIRGERKLFIRSQDESGLIPVGDYVIDASMNYKTDEHNGWMQISMSKNNNTYRIAFYKSKVRAKEVMDDICKWIEQYKDMQFYGRSCTYHVESIFQMPKE